MVAPPATGGPSNGTNPPPNTTSSVKPAALNRANGSAPPISAPTYPYSARRAAPLDLNTVERKGHPSNRDPVQRNRPHGMMEAPTYRPTEAEFRDPMAYIRSISEKASKYGICKIIPPESWNPEFAIDLERFHFRTRRQELNFVEGGNRTNLNYLDNLSKFHKHSGTTLNRFPSVDKRPLDLYKLKKAVEVRGGFEKVCKDKKWAEIGRDLGYSGKIMSSLSTSLKNSYQRWLFPYEEYLRTAKPAVHQQLENEYGGPYSPSTGESPMNKPPQQQQPDHSMGVPSMSPAMQATAALNASLEQPQIPRPVFSVAQPATPAPMEQLPPSSGFAAVNSSGFAAVNSSGFTTVNAPSAFTAVNSQHRPHVKIESQYDTIPPPMPPKHVSPLYPGAGSTATPKPMTPQYGSPLVNGNGAGSNGLKRTMSHDSANGESGSDGVNGDGESGSGRRSKRAKKDGTPMTMGGSMRSGTPQQRTKSTPRKQGEKCETCSKSEDQVNIIVCDNCELGYHKYCLDPPLASFPDYDWHCPKCLVGTGEYGFEDGFIYSLKHFQEKANNFKEHYFSARMPFDPITNTQRRATEDDVEREFWRLVETVTESVEVEYGADIHSTTHGSGFPTIEKNPLNPCSKDPWNLNVLPFHEDSLFRHIKGDISGMTVPWLYVGMCFSTFCWHNEDHYAYSANYQHFGATKTWYGIPGKDAYAFEEAMHKTVPELFESQPDLLFQLVTLVPPDKLHKLGVDVYALDQRAGQFVITFPQAYHAGFNHGFNFNEAVNFAPAEWEPFGQTGVERLQEFRRQPCFSHDELLLTAAASDTTIKTAKWLAPALERMRDKEIEQRNQFQVLHRTAHPDEKCVCIFDTSLSPGGSECQLQVIVEDTELQEEDYQCYHCKAFVYLSQFRCKTSGRVSCLLHTDIVDCCEEPPHERQRGRNHSLTFRHNETDLHAITQKVVDKSRVPENWQAKLQTLLKDEARPPLRTLHTILTEGEKIPYPLEGLDDLGDFVRRCDAWVEEANLYLTRKQQNRGKNEKAWRRKSLKGSKVDEKESEPQLTLDRMKELIEDGDQLGFQASQLDALEEKLVAIDDWRQKVKTILQGRISTAEELESLMEEGKGFMAAMPELTELEHLHQRTKWTEDARNGHENMQTQSLEDCRLILKRAEDLQISPINPEVVYFADLVRRGEFWEIKAREVMSQEDVHYPQLESLHAQVQQRDFPVNAETLAAMDVILAKNREAKRQIITLVERCHDQDFRRRPMYVEARDTMKTVEDLNGKPHGTAELEKELKRHEDWMRKGKKLFGKANAPLHILEQHMKIVEEKNDHCFDLRDTFRPPVEPSSRNASPVEPDERGTLGEEEKPIFCICRMPEAGLMIECEICHEWYHAKCLKLARGKVKECEMFTCPICDWRVKIPRDAARPKLDDLIQWQEELPDLPFQPEEEDLLNRIVDKAQAFRDFLTQYTNGNQLCRTSEEMPEILFYLRKIEGAEVLLSYETNIFRQELHKWQPIAPEAPPIFDQSLSTRKPRPTKQQKLMKELGVEKPEDLPPHLRTKQYVRRKLTESFVTGPLLPKPSQQSPSAHSSVQGQGQMTNRSNTPIGMPRQASTGNPPLNAHSQPYESSFMSAPGSAAYGNAFTTTGTSYQADTPSPMFSPAASQPPESLRDPIMPSAFSGGTSTAPRSHDHMSLFEPSAGLDEDDIRNGLASRSPGPGGVVVDTVGAPVGLSSPPAGEYDMFMELANNDPDTQGEGVAGGLDNENDNEPSQAREALEMIRNASREGDGGEGEAPEPNSNFDDFLADGEEGA